jgi:RimJ/RimL family protein N-acetyltransferase
MATALRRPAAGALRRLRLADGRTVAVRPIRPDDADRLRGFDGAMSEPSRRLRYHGWMPPLSAERAAAMATVDGIRRIALVAIAGHGPDARLVADCRLYAQPGPDRRAEVAIAVGEDHRNVGLGGALLRRLLAAASDAGFRAIVAQVRYENEVMMHLLRTLGFERTAWEMGVVTFTRYLPER